MEPFAPDETAESDEAHSDAAPRPSADRHPRPGVREFTALDHDEQRRAVRASLLFSARSA